MADLAVPTGTGYHALGLACNFGSNRAVPRMRKPSKKPLQVFFAQLLRYLVKVKEELELREPRIFQPKLEYQFRHHFFNGGQTLGWGSRKSPSLETDSIQQDWALCSLLQHESWLCPEWGTGPETPTGPFLPQPAYIPMLTVLTLLTALLSVRDDGTSKSRQALRRGHHNPTSLHIRH